ncbi:hypothetical protein E0F15_18390 [Frankia sp. B2]|uniref:hypothetical protein n=1 Tax=unclassified Frankia TaxID=2632575 RepID=UPI0006CA2E73|nr:MULTISPECIES: hypothetical protein [unclassified Frankia]KPM56957.1 hypothetical protein ACG83_03825 [Frankia sp. R43]TFE26226.1 hypothetical protein E0F15_18390 [Frankia sp. B2]
MLLAGLRVALDESGGGDADVGGRGVRRDPREAVGTEGDARRYPAVLDDVTRAVGEPRIIL